MYSGLAETIVAQASPRGSSNRSIIRLSGKDAFAISVKIFSTQNNYSEVALFGRQRQVLRGIINLPNSFGLEEPDLSFSACLYAMPLPASYTRQDVCELHLPGSQLLVDLVIQSCCEFGARLAEPGEFSLRAFYSGRIDLAQAEAVASLISSRSEEERRSLWSCAAGKLSGKVVSWLEMLLDYAALVESELDFEDDEIDEFSLAEISCGLELLGSEIRDMLGNCQERVDSHGALKVVFAGQTNAGKSSLLNAILGNSESLVSEKKSTTRDLLSYPMDIFPFKFLLFDLPGVDYSQGKFSGFSAGQVLAALELADIVVLVIDASEELTSACRYIIDSMPPVKLLLVLNKADLKAVVTAKELFAVLSAMPKIPDFDFSKIPWLEISCKTGHNIATLKELLCQLAKGEANGGENTHTLSQRIIAALKEAEKFIACAKKMIEENQAEELIAEELRHAYNAVNAITGKGYAEDVLQKIFSKFCIGK